MKKILSIALLLILLSSCSPRLPSPEESNGISIPENSRGARGLVERKPHDKIDPENLQTESVGREEDEGSFVEAISSAATIQEITRQALEESITILLGGDVTHYRENSQTKFPDMKEAMREITPEIEASDIFLFNLETPVCSDEINKPGWVERSSLIFRAKLESMESFEDIVKKGTVVVASLANNHMMNYGPECLAETLQILDKKQIIRVGAGMNLEEAASLTTIELKGKKIGFLSFAQVYGLMEKNWVAGVEKSRYGEEFRSAGISPLETDGEVQPLESDFWEGIRKASEEVDFLIVTMHAGDEYTDLPTEIQKEFAKRAIIKGADLVVGHHPHWIQPFREYKGVDGDLVGKYVFFSLGNLIIDQDGENARKENLLLKITIDGESVTDVERLYFFSQEMQKPARLPDDPQNPIIYEMNYRLDLDVEGFVNPPDFI